MLKTLAIVTVSLLALNSCGGKKESKESKATPPPAATTETKVDSNSTDELFNEFFDSTSEQDDASVAENSAAAKDAQIAEKSTKPETSKATSKEPIKPATKVKANPDGRYVLQVSCVASSELAEKIAKKLEKTGNPVYIAEVQNPTPQLMGTYYRIRIGGFSDRDAAKSFGEAQLTPNGFTFWVDTRSNDNIGSSSSSSAPKPVAKKAAEPAPATESEPAKKASGEEEW